MHLRYIAVENIVGKGEIACNQQIYPFLTMFSTLYGSYFPFYMHFKISSAIFFNLDQSKILSSGNGLNIRLFSTGLTGNKFDTNCLFNPFPNDKF